MLILFGIQHNYVCFVHLICIVIPFQCMRALCMQRVAFTSAPHCKRKFLPKKDASDLYISCLGHTPNISTNFNNDNGSYPFQNNCGNGSI